MSNAAQECYKYTKEHLEAIMVLMKHLVCYKIAILTSNTACALAFAEQLHKTVLLRNSQETSDDNNSSEISITLDVYNEELLSVADVANILYKIRVGSPKVIVLLSSEAMECVVFHVANTLNMVGYDMTWILLEHNSNSLSKNCLPFQVINIQRHFQIDNVTQLPVNGFHHQIVDILVSGLITLSELKEFHQRYVYLTI